MDHSPLQNARYAYSPKLPAVLRGSIDKISLRKGEAAEPDADRDRLRAAFPRTYGMPRIEFGSGDNPGTRKAMTMGVILSGGPAPGGHNVIAGIFDALKAGNPSSTLLGFKGGPGGLVDDKCIEISSELLDRYRNTGGFDLIGSGRTKIETPEQFEKALATARKRKLDEFFATKGAPVAVVGVPKTIDGDLKNRDIETSFGFDTATKLYSELVGNIARDSASGRKYWHFIKLMGRSASHICLECALQTRPNVAFISEEIQARKSSLGEIVDEVADSVAKRSEKGENFGVVLVPEGLVEYIPEFKALIAELNDLLAAQAEAFKALPGQTEQREFARQRLSASTSALYASLPAEIQAQLCWDRDPHGNVQVSRIETEKLLAAMVKVRMAALAAEGRYKASFDFQTHFLGYEGRCAFPSNFDADYCYSLGYVAFLLAASGLTGYLASVRNLASPASEWIAAGVPIAAMMNMERRHGSEKPVIRKALVELGGSPFKAFASRRAEWALSSDYRVPGAIQYFGPSALTDATTETLRLELERA
jgi:pyrophosphate--fructose-6-phosphate 1-phosphotransferase